MTDPKTKFEIDSWDLLDGRGLWLTIAFLVLLTACCLTLRAAETDPAVVPLLKRSFFHGREYFVLRSGRAQLILQADKADLAPALMYMLFDAQDSRQSARKERAWNFGEGAGFTNSALEVVLGGFPYTAIGHQTDTRWTSINGVPTVEAVWWAGGLRVTERFQALVGQGVFLRSVELASANLAGSEPVALRLSLPFPGAKTEDGALIEELPGVTLKLSADKSHPYKLLPEISRMELGPVVVQPGQTISFTTYLQVQIPAGKPAAFDPASALAASRSWWSRASHVMTDDATVREIYAKACFGLPGMVADNGIMNAGIFEYGAQWVRDTSNTLLGLTHAGQFELARAGFDYLLRNMVRDDGATMIANAFDDPDREQFDQMGELIHALKSYRDWSGDDSLIREHRAKLVAMIERPLRKEFRDETGMVHNRREFWERVFDDAYELAYQNYVVLGLRDAADLAGPLGAEEKKERWKTEADRILNSVLHHPTRALVEDNRLIKRRGTDGRRVTNIQFPPAAPDVPLKTESAHLAEPDATLALPIAFRLVDPQSTLAGNTLDELEKLWNARWSGGGYERYHSSGQCDQPGPWTFATTFILRAQHEAGQFVRSRRSLEWLNEMPGGRTGAWFEEIPLVRSQAPTAGLIPWTSGEISLFVVCHLLGVRFDGGQLVLRPALYPGSPPLQTELRFRQARLQLDIPGSGPMASAECNGQKWLADDTGTIRLPADFAGGRIRFIQR